MIKTYCLLIGARISNIIVNERESELVHTRSGVSRLDKYIALQFVCITIREGW